MPPEFEATSSPPRAALAFIFVTVVLDYVAIGVVAPVLPNLVKSMRGDDTQQAAVIYSVFVTVFAVMQFFFSPVLGAMSDRFGRRPIILLSAFGLGLDYILMALAPTLGWLFVGRVISGITAASVATASAYIADITPPEKRAGVFALLGAAFGFGFVLGPATGGLLGSIDLRLPFWLAAGLSLASAAWGYFILPESLPKDRREFFAWSKANPVGSLALVRSHPMLFGLAIVTLLYCIAHESIPATAVLYLGYRYEWTERTVGLTLAGAGVCSIVVSGFLVPLLIARFGERRMMQAGLFFGALAFGIYGFAETGMLFLVGVPIMAFWGLFAPASQSLMTQLVGRTQQGQLQGALNAVRGFAGFLGPTLFGATFAYFIGGGDAWNIPGAAFYLSALLLLAAMAVAWISVRNSGNEIGHSKAMSEPEGVSSSSIELQARLE